MSKKVLLLIVCIAVLTWTVQLLPVFLATQKTPTNLVFTGQATWFDPWDLNVYFAAIRSGQDSGFLLENQFTTEPNTPIFYYPLYTSIGTLFPLVSPIVLFYALSGVISLLLVSICVSTITRIFPDTTTRAFAAVGVLFGGGIGFLLHPEISSPDIEFTGFMFYSALQRPHEGIALSAYLVTLVGFYFLSYSQIKRKNPLVFATLISAVIVGIWYPFYALSIGCITVGFAVYTKYRQLGSSTKISPVLLSLTLSAIASITAAIMIWNLGQNATFVSVIGQKLESPSVLQLLYGYGVLSFAVVYHVVSKKQKSLFVQYLLLWLCCSILLSFLPLGFARFYLRATFFPLVILSVYSWQNIYSNIRLFLGEQSYLQSMVVTIVCVQLLATNAYIFTARVQAIHSTNPWYYFTTGEATTLEYLDTQAISGSGVASGYTFGNRIPVYSSARSYLGHKLQTPDFFGKAQQLSEIYTGRMTQEQALSFLHANHISYVYLGSEEQEIFKTTPNSLESAYPFLQPVHQVENSTLYSVIE